MAGVSQHPDEFPDPQDDGSSCKDEAPVRPAQGYYVKHLAAEGDDEVLSRQDEQGHQAEASDAGAHAREGASVRIECLGVEHVPELEKNEDGEEQGQFVRCQCMFRG